MANLLAKDAAFLLREANSLIKSQPYLNELHSNGYAFLPNFFPQLPSQEAISILGNFCDLGSGNQVHCLKPLEKSEGAPNSYSSLYGLENFPLHTDLAHFHRPPRYLVLRCVFGSPFVATLLLDSMKLSKKIGHNLLSRAIVSPRKSRNGRTPLLRILDVSDKKYLFRWDSKFIKPASEIGMRGFQLFLAAVDNSEPDKIVLADLGDTLVIDNHRMLHGRTKVPTNCISRVIERSYLESIK